VHEIEVDMVEPQLLQGSVECPPDGVRREVLVPDLCRDMQFCARHARGRERRSNRLLVAIHFGGVDVPIAERKSALHRGAADIALHAEGAEPEFWHRNALGLDVFHGCSKRSRPRDGGR
jgi:hypothetical protein